MFDLERKYFRCMIQVKYTLHHKPSELHGMIPCYSRPGEIDDSRIHRAYQGKHMFPLIDFFKLRKGIVIRLLKVKLTVLRTILINELMKVLRRN